MTRISKDKKSWTAEQVVSELESLADPRVRDKMSYFGIRATKAYGVSAPLLHRLAKQIGKDHVLALQLWNSGIHEAKVLAPLISQPEKVSAAQMERWARDFDSWDIVDGTCCYLFAFATAAWDKAIAWSEREEEYVKRAGFSLMAYLAYKDKESPDGRFLALLRIIQREAGDERNFVKKAVNWALRNIGKRNPKLNRAAIRTAEELLKGDSRTARWVASDALRELKSPAVQNRLKLNRERLSDPGK
jgi:3-methyladenine DNA glycosylase AlkD